MGGGNGAKSVYAIQFLVTHMITIMMAGVIFGLHERMFLPRLRIIYHQLDGAMTSPGAGGQRASDTNAKSLSDEKTVKQMSEWQVSRYSTNRRKRLAETESEITVGSTRQRAGRAFLAYVNYDKILKWNRSNFFAIAVGSLADQIRAYE